jgi:hypothetical protein
MVANDPCPFCHYPVAIDNITIEHKKDSSLANTPQKEGKAKPEMAGESYETRGFHINPYTWTGLGFIIIGAGLILASLFVFSFSWLTAMGIAVLILSFILLALGRTIPKLSPEVSILLLETGIDNLATFFEELGVKSKAIYLPSSVTNGKPKALVPLNYKTSSSKIVKTIPQRLIVRYTSDPEDIGLLVTTMGNVATGMLESRPGPNAGEVESAMAHLLTGVLGVADGTRVIVREHGVSFEIHNPRIENRKTWSSQSLGSPLASIAASVAAEAWGRPFIITQEERSRRKHSVELKVVQ